jgi:ABC-type multidrug transport system ATPase subunit
MRQRLGIALALLADPPTLILDEPVNGLDPAGIVEIRDLMLELAGGGRTILVSSHLLTEVEKTCDHVTIVDRGRIVASGTPQTLAARRTDRGPPRRRRGRPLSGARGGRVPRHRSPDATGLWVEGAPTARS